MTPIFMVNIVPPFQLFNSEMSNLAHNSFHKILSHHLLEMSGLSSTSMAKIFSYNNTPTINSD